MAEGSFINIFLKTEKILEQIEIRQFSWFLISE